MKISRRRFVAGSMGLAASAVGGAVFFGSKVRARVDRMSILDSFYEGPTATHGKPFVASVDEVAVAKGTDPANNVTDAIAKLGGMSAFVEPDDVVVVKVSAQWWNQGMTNVAAAKRVIEEIVSVPGFRGEVIVVENTHFQFKELSIGDPKRGLTRAFSHPSEVNVDVPGWNSLGDLVAHFESSNAPVSFVGLVDAGPSALSGEAWFDPDRKHGEYGGDLRGPLAANEIRDGYHWDFTRVFEIRRSRVALAKNVLSWPRFTSPHSGRVVDLRDGVFRREGQKLIATAEKLKFINVTTANEHGSTGFTGACKSTMGLLDMSCGALGTHPLCRGFQSVHYFGRTGRSDSHRDPTWRMAGPLAFWANNVRKPDLVVSVAHWFARIPTIGYDESDDMRHHAACRVKTETVAAGRSPVAIDTWLVRHLAHPLAEKNKAMLDLDNSMSKISKFFREYSRVLEST